jgi:hypothetical protein
MKRYIEIIFDDSISMEGIVNGEEKHLTAKKIIKNQILPKLDLKYDKIFLRTLSSKCWIGYSKTIEFENNNYQNIIDTIDSIKCEKSTPLYHTIKDSINACKNSGFSENHIFILTDGDDNCQKNPEDILGKDFLKIKQQLNLNTILVQFAIESDITKNNLTALGQKIGATNVSLSSADLKDFKIVENKITKAIIKSSLNKDGILPHCEVDDNKNSIQLSSLEKYDFFLVQLLHQEKLLSWKPALSKRLNEKQLVELEFLYTLRFKNNLPESQVKVMLLNLNKPYVYSFDCIYWDFQNRLWKYFTETPELKIIDNPDALKADNKNTDSQIPDSVFHESFKENKIYNVTKINDDRLFDIRQSKFEIHEAFMTLEKPNTIILRNDNFIEFES